VWGHMDGWGWGWFAAGHLLWWVLVVVVLVGLVRWAIPRTGPRTAPPPQTDRALDILRERFARGEIDETEFQARKRTLGN
jgi:putative membrane protein